MGVSGTARPPAVTRRRARSSSRSPTTIRSSDGGRRLGAPEHGPHAGDELLGAERLDDVVVGAELEARDPVDLVTARREDHDRDRGVAADGPDDVEPVDLWAGRGRGRSRPAVGHGRGRGAAAPSAAVRTAKPGVFEVVADERRRSGARPRRRGSCAWEAPETAKTPGEDTRPASERKRGSAGRGPGGVGRRGGARRAPGRRGPGLVLVEPAMVVGDPLATRVAVRRAAGSHVVATGRSPATVPAGRPPHAPRRRPPKAKNRKPMNRKKNRNPNHGKPKPAGRRPPRTTAPPAAPMFDAMPAWKPMKPPTGR